MSAPSGPLLEVIACSAADARAARAGGADRVELVAHLEADGLTPEIRTVAEVVASSVPARVMIRPADVFTVTGADREGVLAQAHALAATDADAFVTGYVDGRGGLDVALLAEIADTVRRPVTLHRAFDQVRDPESAYRAVSVLAGYDTILSGGGAAGLAAGGAARLAAWAAWAIQTRGGGPSFLAGGGLELAHVADLWGAGVRQFHIGTAARASRLGPVETERVRVFRDLLDSLAGS